MSNLSLMNNVTLVELHYILARQNISAYMSQRFSSYLSFVVSEGGIRLSFLEVHPPSQTGP